MPLRRSDLEQAVRYLLDSAAAEVTMLREIAGKVDGETRTDILKAVAILAVRGG